MQTSCIRENTFLDSQTSPSRESKASSSSKRSQESSVTSSTTKKGGRTPYPSTGTASQQGSLLQRKSMHRYMERNTFEMNKGMAITVMCTAIESWGMKIMEASHMAADVVGCSAYSARKWAAEFFLSILSLTPEDLDDNECVELILQGTSLQTPTEPHPWWAILYQCKRVCEISWKSERKAKSYMWHVQGVG